MTAPTLPTTLSRLAELLPERFNVRQGTVFPEDYYYEAQWHSAFHIVFRTSPYTGSGRWSGWGVHGELILETALREECAARGWEISLDIRPGTQARRHCAIVRTPRFHSAHADTPAHALALALLAALMLALMGTPAPLSNVEVIG